MASTCGKLSRSAWKLRRKTLPAPVPLEGPLTLDSFEPLWAVANVPKEDRLLLLATLAECCRPNTPHPVLEFLGTQGAAKSTTQRHLRALLDPNEVPLLDGDATRD